MFENKMEQFRKKSFLREIKESYTELMNEFLKDDEKMMVFPRNNLYLPTKKIGKNNPLAEDIRADNEARDVWNESVREAIERDVPEKMIRSVKMIQIADPIARSVRSQGNSHENFRKTVVKAAMTIRAVTRAWLQLPPDKKALAVGEKMGEFLSFCSAKAGQFLRSAKKHPEKGR